ncbi:MAG: hypothetical protein OXE86_21865 [Alphaproteobacteria bacterium]|nr:hypothetical protein [Alphaproteobacteria bacterium]
MTGKPEVRVKPTRYQPSKAEIEDEVTIRRADGTVPTPEELARAALQPMRVVTDPDV